MSSDREKRLLRILDLVSSRSIATQEELVHLLKTEGWDVTQSSVSRDVKALGLVKQGGFYKKPTRAAGRHEDPDETRVREGVLLVKPAGENLVVVHTASGEASRVGVAMDRLAWAEVVGTVAGDDTIFVAVHDAEAQRSLMKRLVGHAAAAR